MTRSFIIETDLQRARLVQYVEHHPLPMQVEVGRVKEQRTGPQNDRLWKLHRLAAAFVGCSAEDMHEDMLCAHFGYTEKRMPSGDLKRVPLKRSSARDKAEFRVFMDFVENFYAANLGVWLDQEAA